MVRINESIKSLVAAQSYTETGETIKKSSKTHRVTFVGLEDSEFSVRAENDYKPKGFIGKIFSSIVNFFRFKARYVPLDIEDPKGAQTRIMVNVNSLAKRLHIAKNDVLMLAKDGNLGEFIENRAYLKSAKDEAANIEANYAIDPDLNMRVITDKHGNKFKVPVPDEDLAAYSRAIALLKHNPNLSKPADGSFQVHRIKLGSRVIKVITDTNLPPQDRKVIYLFGKLLGKGGFGKVMHTYDAGTNTFVDGKDGMASMKSVSTPQSKEEIVKSAKIIADLHKSAGGKAEGIKDHELIVTDKANGNIGSLSTLYDGSIEQRAIRVRMNPTVISSAFKQLAQGLDLMHRNKIAHRDIKPANILARFEADGTNEFHLNDFDFANLYVKGESRRDDPGTVMFKPILDRRAYGNAFSNDDLELQREIAFQMDIFAMCSTFYFLASGELPYDPLSNGYPSFTTPRSELEEKLRKKVNSKEFCDVIIQGLNEDRTKRPSSGQLKTAAENYFRELDLYLEQS